jgi:hypothetical protein
VSDPGPRVCNGPAPVRRGRSRHGCQVSPSAVSALFVFARTRRGRPHVRTDPRCIVRTTGPVVGGHLGRQVSSSHRTMRNQMCVWSRTSGNMRVNCLPCSGERCERDHCRSVGHHASDGRSVLGTVQGSARCSDRASARPSGLDGACAQLADWQLRDGRNPKAQSGNGCERRGEVRDHVSHLAATETLHLKVAATGCRAILVVKLGAHTRPAWKKHKPASASDLLTPREPKCRLAVEFFGLYGIGGSGVRPKVRCYGVENGTSRLPRRSLKTHAPDARTRIPLS